MDLRGARPVASVSDQPPSATRGAARWVSRVDRHLSTAPRKAGARPAFTRPRAAETPCAPLATKGHGARTRVTHTLQSGTGGPREAPGTPQLRPHGSSPSVNAGRAHPWSPRRSLWTTLGGTVQANVGRVLLLTVALVAAAALPLEVAKDMSRRGDPECSPHRRDETTRSFGRRLRVGTPAQRYAPPS